MGMLDKLLALFGGQDDPFDVAQASIYSSSSVDRRLSDLCERALAAHQFSTHGVIGNNKHLISFLHDGLSYVSIVEVQNNAVFGAALIVNAVYGVGSEGLAAKLSSIRGAYA